jgi:hypothetical protein
LNRVTRKSLLPPVPETNVKKGDEEGGHPNPVRHAVRASGCVAARWRGAAR